MYEHEATKLLMGYDELCKMTGTKDCNALRRVLLSPRQEVAGELILRTVGRPVCAATGIHE